LRAVGIVKGFGCTVWGVGCEWPEVKAHIHGTAWEDMVRFMAFDETMTYVLIMHVTTVMMV
jgi:hypothetical protein